MEEERSASRTSLERAEKAEEALAQKQDGLNSALAEATAKVELANEGVQVRLDLHLFMTLPIFLQPGGPPPPGGGRPSQSLPLLPCLHKYALPNCLSILQDTGLLPAPCMLLLHTALFTRTPLYLPVVLYMVMSVVVH